jgi:hypothetical protein
LDHSKKLHPDCEIDSDWEFVFSAATAASFNNPTKGKSKPVNRAPNTYWTTVQYMGVDIISVSTSENPVKSRWSTTTGHSKK